MSESKVDKLKQELVIVKKNYEEAMSCVSKANLQLASVNQPHSYFVDKYENQEKRYMELSKKHEGMTKALKNMKEKCEVLMKEKIVIQEELTGVLKDRSEVMDLRHMLSKIQKSTMLATPIEEERAVVETKGLGVMRDKQQNNIVSVVKTRPKWYSHLRIGDVENEQLSI